MLLKRRILGIVILVGLEGGLLWINLLSHLNIFDIQDSLSVIERAFSLMTLIILSWLWLFPEPNPKGDKAASGLIFLDISFLLVFLVPFINKPVGLFFIYSPLDIFWQISSLLVLVIAIVLLIIRKPNRYLFGLFTLILALIGHLIYLLVPMPFDYYPAVIPIYQFLVFLILLNESGILRKGIKTVGESKTSIAVSRSDEKIDEIESISNYVQSSSNQPLLEKTEVVHTEKKDLIKTLETPTDLGKSDLYLEQLRMTLEELAYVQNELVEAKSKIEELGKQDPAIPLISEDQVQMIASITQELRQPMSSIVGYTDLLMGESVGILGALQRKFLERVKFSSEKVIDLIEDLMRITTNETERIIMNPQVIDLNNIIDNAIAYTSAQLREKNITMRLDIPESPPMIHIDREALQQILIHLLQNAGAATLIEGTILLCVKIQTENEKDFLLIQVVDGGGGIPSKDLPRVFARRYRTENVLIQGLGDTGVGLSITKALAEAQFGRIWVETSLGVGSTISVLLPIVSAKSDEEEQDTNH